MQVIEITRLTITQQRLRKRVTAMRFTTQLQNRRRVAAIAAVLIGVLAPAIGGAAPLGATTLMCTNLASGANWKINIDFAKSTVDSNPAHIDDAKISWRDRDGENYTLDRKSGNLTVIVASSTGGYFIYDRCTPDASKPAS
jgi:hypothetical protein